MTARSPIELLLLAAAWIVAVTLPALRAGADPVHPRTDPPVTALNASLARLPDIIVVVDPLQVEAEPFVPVVGGAAQFKLQSAGLSAHIEPVLPDHKEDPLRSAERAGAAAVLLCSYSLDGGQMAVTIGWYDEARPAPTATVQARGDVDLHLDDVILGEMDDLLGRMHDRVRELAARRAGFHPEAAAPGQDEAAPLEPAHPQPGAPPGAEPRQSESPGARSVHLLIAGGFAPFVPTGAASAYFGLGYLPSMLVSVLLPTRAGPVGIGLYSGMDYFSAVGSIDTSRTWLVPVGIDLRYEIDAGALRPYFHVSGGPAVLVMQTGSQGTIVGLMPFLRSGIGLSWRFGQRIGAAITADYDVYFEMPYLITGFSPSASMEVVL